jgi:hypothetical protein
MSKEQEIKEVLLTLGASFTDFDETQFDRLSAFGETATSLQERYGYDLKPGAVEGLAVSEQFDVSYVEKIGVMLKAIDADIARNLAEIGEDVVESDIDIADYARLVDDELFESAGVDMDGFNPEAPAIDAGFELNELGTMCATLGRYGKSVAKGQSDARLSVSKIDEDVNPEVFAYSVDVERGVEMLEMAGYLERYKDGDDFKYQLKQDRDVVGDALAVHRYTEDEHHGVLFNLDFLYNAGDRAEMSNRGVNLVREPEKNIQ